MASVRLDRLRSLSRAGDRRLCLGRAAGDRSHSVRRPSHHRGALGATLDWTCRSGSSTTRRGTSLCRDERAPSGPGTRCPSRRPPPTDGSSERPRGSHRPRRRSSPIHRSTSCGPLPPFLRVSPTVGGSGDERIRRRLAIGIDVRPGPEVGRRGPKGEVSSAVPDRPRERPSSHCDRVRRDPGPTRPPRTARLAGEDPVPLR
jgi:hypothetical protein